MTIKTHYPALPVEAGDSKAKDLVSMIARLAVSNVRFKDILIHEGRPLKINAPGGLKIAENLIDPKTREAVFGGVYIPTKSELESLLDLLDENWRDKISDRAIDQGRSFGGRDRLRLNLYYEGINNIAGVIRRFPASAPDLRSIKAPDAITNMLVHRGGLILVVGQASAGKSTTCAAMLNEISKRWATHIVTVENPIEFKHEDKRATFSQRQVGSLGLATTAAGVEDAMRQSPGVIYVAEIRDEETAKAVFFAIESGHLVIATSHARSPTDGLIRLLSFFPTDRRARCASLASNLVGVIYQVLVPVITKGKGGGDLNLECDDFQAFFEVLPANESVSDLIASDRLKDLSEKMTALDTGNAITEIKDAVLLNKGLADGVRRGTVLRAEALAVSNNTQLLLKRLDGTGAKHEI